MKETIHQYLCICKCVHVSCYVWYACSVMVCIDVWLYLYSLHVWLYLHRATSYSLQQQVTQKGIFNGNEINKTHSLNHTFVFDILFCCWHILLISKSAHFKAIWLDVWSIQDSCPLKTFLFMTVILSLQRLLKCNFYHTLRILKNKSFNSAGFSKSKVRLPF